MDRGTVLSRRGKTWRYVDNRHWGGICSLGRSQSLVDHVLGDAEVIDYECIHFNHYHLTGPVVIEHDGHGGTVPRNGSSSPDKYIHVKR
ncbi:unnamed protein product [Cylicocyclus nassatus]|uniref:Uncharacterized protein n=1 Tax=Cylicocyclus nassatus TaxID=53992 RepID=A0AA36DTM2_CYLNA|nr:unnamed protein product [Cylicocyclus nassatus]